MLRSYGIIRVSVVPWAMLSVYLVQPLRLVRSGQLLPAVRVLTVA